LFPVSNLIILNRNLEFKERVNFPSLFIHYPNLNCLIIYALAPRTVQYITIATHTTYVGGGDHFPSHHLTIRSLNSCILATSYASMQYMSGFPIERVVCPCHYVSSTTCQHDGFQLFRCTHLISTVIFVNFAVNLCPRNTLMVI